MKTLSIIIDWCKDAILIPVFGKFYAEFTLLIAFILSLAGICLTIIFLVKYKRYKSEAKLKHDLLVKQTQKTDEYYKRMSGEQNKNVLLNDDLIKERINVDRLNSELESKNNTINSMSEQEELYLTKIDELTTEILNMKEFKKRSDAARKGVQTRKRNQEKLAALIESDESTPEPIVVVEETTPDVVIVEEVSETKTKARRRKKDKKVTNNEELSSSEVANK